MKNYLLAVMMMAAVSTSAQQLNFADRDYEADQRQKIAHFDVISAKAMAPVLSLENEKTTARAAGHSAYDNNVWYARPKGTYYYTYFGESRQYAMLVVPPFTPVKFENQCPEGIASQVKWSITNGQQSYDISAAADADNNVIEHYEKNKYGTTYPPTMTYNGTSFSLVDMVVIADSFRISLEPFNMTKSRPSYGINPNDNNAFSYFNASDRIGDYDLDNDEKKDSARIRAIAQVYEKPLTGLYLSEVSCYFLAKSNPLAGGKKLTARICKLAKDNEGNLLKNAAGRYIVGEQIAEMISEEMDVTMFTNQQPVGKNNLQSGIMYFAAFGEDELGNPVTQPIMIDEEFMIMIDGLEQEGLDENGVDLNFNFVDIGNDTIELQSGAQPAYMYYQDVATGKNYDRSLSYYSKEQYVCVSLPLMLAGELDGFQVVTTQNVHKQTISAEGGRTFAQFTTQDGNKGSSPAGIWTNFPIMSKDGDDYYDTGNYIFDGLPDWAQPLVDDTYYEHTADATIAGDEDVRGMNYISFIVDALPVGQTGRKAEINVISKRGAKGNAPFYILQGDAITEGVQSIRYDAQGNCLGAYDMNGHRIQKEQKGLIIVNGKKYINK